MVINLFMVCMFDLMMMLCVGFLNGYSVVVFLVDVMMMMDGIVFILTGVKDYTVRLWDVVTRECIVVGEGYVGVVVVVVFFLNLKNGVLFVILGGVDCVFCVWDIDGVRRNGDGELNVTAGIVGDDKFFYGVVVVLYFCMVVMCLSDKMVKIWKMFDLVLLVMLCGYCCGVWACAFFFSDRVFVIAGGDKMVKIWSVDDCVGSDINGVCLCMFEGYIVVVLSIKFMF